LTGGSVSIVDIVAASAATWMVNEPIIPATDASYYTSSTPVFNPHSGDFDPMYGYVVANFVVPGTRRYGNSLSYFSPLGLYLGEITLNSGPHAWASYVNTVFDALAPSSGSGFMDIKYIGNGNLITCASLQGKLFHINVAANPPTVLMALDLAAAVNGGLRTFSGTTIRVIPGRNRLITTYGLRYVVLVGWDDNYNFSVKDFVDTCLLFPGTCAFAATTTGVLPTVGPYSGAHYVKFSDDYERVYVACYYQSYPSNKRILSFSLDANKNNLQLEDGLDHGATPLLGTHNPHALAFAEWSAST